MYPSPQRALGQIQVQKPTTAVTTNQKPEDGES